ncbi:MAG TPA: phosphodiester glycosidase family protein, partial [Anaerolineales bacterium]|nr:phosphodiester glycosidase family protein [Anaerolineales bacterium]
VVDVHDGLGATPLLFDEAVLAARGARAREFLQGLRPGETVGISMEISDLGFGCRGRAGFDWSDAYAAIGGGFVFLRDGEIEMSDDAGAYTRAPRTAVCLNDQFVYFVVVDGRKDGSSEGMTFPELAEFCQKKLEATWGLNQDGGGSSTMWIEGRVVNTPSDGVERVVANGLMMVAVEPAARSRRFGQDFEVAVQVPEELRSGPGPFFPSLRTLAPGDAVRIASAAPSLQGVFAAGSYWWKAAAGGEEGFVPEQALVNTEKALAWFRLPPLELAVHQP